MPHQDGYTAGTLGFAGRGYVVACVNYHGSSGFGQKFLETITTRYGEKEYADTEAATDFMLKQGYIDRSRLVATGGSYGGYMVAFMNGHTNRYKAFVCHAGCYDWVSMMATDAYCFSRRNWGLPLGQLALVMRQSPPLRQGGQDADARGSGELDYRAGHSAAVLQLAQGEGCAGLVWFPDENHWILKPQNSRLWYGEYFAWIKNTRRAGRRPAKNSYPCRRLRGASPFPAVLAAMHRAALDRHRVGRRGSAAFQAGAVRAVLMRASAASTSCSSAASRDTSTTSIVSRSATAQSSVSSSGCACPSAPGRPAYWWPRSPHAAPSGARRAWLQGAALGGGQNGGDGDMQGLRCRNPSSEKPINEWR